MSRWIHTFDATGPGDEAESRRLRGGKGHSLALMTAAGLPVPPGFTISTAACAQYFSNGRALPDGLTEELRTHLTALEATTGRNFGVAPRPLLVSVRSGAAHSMPGMMDTVLNCGLSSGLIRDLTAGRPADADRAWSVYAQYLRTWARIVARVDGLTLHEAACAGGGAAEAQDIAVHLAEKRALPPAYPWAQLLACIHAVFASWHNERAIAYRERHGLGSLDGTAVTIQAMWPSRVSGVLFTTDPTAPDAGVMVIESAFGLGEAVVSGDAAPDRFRIDRSSGAVVETVVGRKAAKVLALDDPDDADRRQPSLSTAQLAELYRLGKQVESHHGKPVDIEWGIADGRIALLQSRVIRGLDVHERTTSLRAEEIQRLKALAAEAPDGRRQWVAHNLGETLRLPTTLSWAVAQRLMRGDGGFGHVYRLLGWRPDPALNTTVFLELILWRIYADPLRLARLFQHGLPMAYDPAVLASDPTAIERAPSMFRADRAEPTLLLLLPAIGWSLMTAGRRVRRWTGTILADLERVHLPAWNAWCAAEERRDLSSMAAPDLLRLLHARIDKTHVEFAPWSLLPGFLGGLALERLRDLLGMAVGEVEGDRLARLLTGGDEGSSTAEQDRLLIAVAHGEADAQDFLRRFGHRCAGEMDLSVPRWREDAAGFARMLDRAKHGDRAAAAQRAAQHHAERASAEARLPDLLREAGASTLHRRVITELGHARRLLPWRETGKHHLMRGHAVIREAAMALGAAIGVGADVVHLDHAELARAVAGAGESWQPVIAQRKLDREAARRLDAPLLVDSTDIDRLGLPPERLAGEALIGDPVAPGIGVGTVRIVTDPEEPGDLGSDYILVCPSTDPGWTPLFMGACGLIVERGGVLSHGAIVARDFGIPAIVLADATRLLTAGVRLRIDGSAGTVVPEPDAGTPTAKAESKTVAEVVAKAVAKDVAKPAVAVRADR